MKVGIWFNILDYHFFLFVNTYIQFSFLDLYMALHFMTEIINLSCHLLVGLVCFNFYSNLAVIPSITYFLHTMPQPLLHFFHSEPGNGLFKRKADAAFQTCKVRKLSASSSIFSVTFHDQHLTVSS